ncbi:hypothetical protein [Catellatospora sp. NPDC049133]|uniref:hypothetical protein n=1 Tax=Catellatospora sp. NPDC049133 TaxID=3155499 RepID=UPI0033C4A3B6
MRAARKRAIDALAWASLGVALVGGTFAVSTFIGEIVRWVIHLLPWEWVAPLALLAAVGATVLDIVVDAEPNRAAVFSMLVIPTLASAAPGKLGDTITDLTHKLSAWVDSGLREWLGASSSTGLAILCIAATILMAKRVVTRSRSRSAV